MEVTERHSRHREPHPIGAYRQVHILQCLPTLIEGVAVTRHGVGNHNIKRLVYGLQAGAVFKHVTDVRYPLPVIEVHVPQTKATCKRPRAVRFIRPYIRQFHHIDIPSTTVRIISPPLCPQGLRHITGRGKQSLIIFHKGLIPDLNFPYPQIFNRRVQGDTKITDDVLHLPPILHLLQFVAVGHQCMCHSGLPRRQLPQCGIFLYDLK